MDRVGVESTTSASLFQGSSYISKWQLWKDSHCSNPTRSILLTNIYAHSISAIHIPLPLKCQLTHNYRDCATLALVYSIYNSTEGAPRYRICFSECFCHRDVDAQCVVKAAKRIAGESFYIVINARAAEMMLLSWLGSPNLRSAFQVNLELDWRRIFVLVSHPNPIGD